MGTVLTVLHCVHTRCCYEIELIRATRKLLIVLLDEESFLGSIESLRLLRNYPLFMGPENLFPLPYELTVSPDPEPDK